MTSRNRAKKQKSRVSGPYRNGLKWRIVVFDGGRRKSFVADTYDDAEALKANHLALFGDRSLTAVATALEEYLAERDTGDLLPQSLLSLAYRLRQFLPLESTLGEVTPDVAAKLYKDSTKRRTRFGQVPSAATHHVNLRMARAFFRWCVETGKARSNPFDKVKPIGRVRYGKPQLRIDEARLLNDVLLRHADAGDEGALACLVQMVMGLRSAEVLGLRVRDLDNRGKDLWVEGTKTRNAKRPLEIKSEPLRHRLLKLCQGRDSQSLIFGAHREQPYFNAYLYRRVRHFCRLAGVPVVCPHSLRGLHSTLAVARGASSRFVAEALGHGGDEVTKRHYIDRATVRNATIERVADLLDSNSCSEAASTTHSNLDLSKLAEALRTLSPEQQELLFVMLKAKEVGPA